MPDGVLLVDKPAGPTSQTVVTVVRKTLGEDKAGHTGTLDPFATGLLIVCLGRATKLAGYLTGEDKSYRATVALGVATDTDDATGKEIRRADASGLRRDPVEAALAAFRGAISQVPPDYSAIQKDGERMYKKARKGEDWNSTRGRWALKVNGHGIARIDSSGDRGRRDGGSTCRAIGASGARTRGDPRGSPLSRTGPRAGARTRPREL